MSGFDDNLNACARIVEKGDPDRFLATMAAPVGLRRVLFPLYAFNVEVSRAPWVTQEAMLGEIRLQWWRDALEEIRAGGIVRSHEVVTPLALVLTPDTASDLDKLVEARRWDLYRDAFEDKDACIAYIDATSGNLLNVAARAVGEAAPQPFRDIGFAGGMAAFLRAVPALEAQGRVPIQHRDVEMVRDLAALGLERLQAARAGFFQVQARRRAIGLSAWQCEPLLIAAKKRPTDVFEGKLRMSEARKRFRLLWQSATNRL